MRIGEPQGPGAGLIDHHRRLSGGVDIRQHAVLAVFLGEQPPGQRADVVELEEAVIHRRHVEVHLPATPDLDVGYVLGVGRVERVHRRAGDGADARQAAHLLRKRVVTGGADPEDQLGVRSSQALGQSETGLPVDGGRGYDQPDQNGELDHHQGLAQQNRAGGLDHAALEHCGGTEAGQHKGRIDRGQKANQQRRAQDAWEQERIDQEVQAQITLHEAAERLDQQLRERQGDHHRDGHLDQGFAHELDHQVDLPGAGGFAHTDLDASSSRTGRHQGDEVDGRDQHDQEPYPGDPVGDIRAPRRFDGGHRQARLGQVGVPQSDGMETELGAAAQRGEQGRFGPSGDDKCTLQVGRGLAGREAHEGVGADVPEQVHRVELRQVRIGAFLRGEDLGREVGVGWQILEHGCDPHRAPGLAGRGQRAGAWRARNGGLDLKGVADRQVPAEVLAGDAAGDHHRVGLLQRRVQVAGQDRQGEHLEDLRVGPGEGFLADARIPKAMTDTGKGLHQARGDDTGHHRLQLSGDQGLGGVRGAGRLARLLEHVGDLVDLLITRQPMVVAELAAHELGDKDRGGEGDRQAQDADRGVEAVARQIAQRRGEIVAEHRLLPLRPRAGFRRPPARRAG